MKEKETKSNDILEEAIADAKKIREIALINAKNALEETFTPKLKSIISRKIQAESEEMEDEEEIENDDNEETYESDIDIDGDSEEIPEDETDEDDELDLESALKEIEDEDEITDNDELADDENVDFGNDETTDDIPMDDEEDIDIDIEDDDIPMDDDIDIDIEDDEGIDDNDEIEIELDSDDEEDLDLESIIKEIESEDDEIDIEDNEEYEMEELKTENKKLKESLKIIKDELNEVKLVNDKLIYINKLFKIKNLTESQKFKIVENFDKAKNDREIKLIYNALRESLVSISNKNKVNESIQRRGVATPKKSVNKEKIIKESTDNDFALRMKKLAGIL